MHISATPAAPSGADFSPLHRHLLAQVGIVGKEIDAREARSVLAAGDAAATMANFLSLRDGSGEIDLLAAQAAGLHEIAMVSLSRAGANWNDTRDHHRNVWDAARSITVFMRLLNAIAQLRAAKRKAAKEDAAAAAEAAAVQEAVAPAPSPAPVDVGALADEVMENVDSAEALMARQTRARGSDADEKPAPATPEEMANETIQMLTQIAELDQGAAVMMAELARGTPPEEIIAWVARAARDPAALWPPVQRVRERESVIGCDIA